MFTVATALKVGTGVGGALALVVWQSYRDRNAAVFGDSAKAKADAKWRIAHRQLVFPALETLEEAVARCDFVLGGDAPRYPDTSEEMTARLHEARRAVAVHGSTALAMAAAGFKTDKPFDACGDLDAVVVTRADTKPTHEELGVFIHNMLASIRRRFDDARVKVYVSELRQPAAGMEPRAVTVRLRDLGVVAPTVDGPDVDAGTGIILRDADVPTEHMLSAAPVAVNASEPSPMNKLAILPFAYAVSFIMEPRTDAPSEMWAARAYKPLTLDVTVCGDSAAANAVACDAAAFVCGRHTDTKVAVQRAPPKEHNDDTLVVRAPAWRAEALARDGTILISSNMPESENAWTDGERMAKYVGRGYSFHHVTDVWHEGCLVPAVRTPTSWWWRTLTLGPPTVCTPLSTAMAEESVAATSYYSGCITETTERARAALAAMYKLQPRLQ